MRFKQEIRLLTLSTIRQCQPVETSSLSGCLPMWSIFPLLKLFLPHLLLWPHSLSHLRWFQRWKEEGWRPVSPYYDIRCCNLSNKPDMPVSLLLLFLALYLVAGALASSGGWLPGTSAPLQGLAPGFTLPYTSQLLPIHVDGKLFGLVGVIDDGAYAGYAPSLSMASRRLLDPCSATSSSFGLSLLPRYQ